MFEVNINVSGPPLLGIDSGICSQTPRTPEILNSLIAMTNPLEDYAYTANQNKSTLCDSHSSCSGSPLDSSMGKNTPQSVQQTCSQLIKAGLKLSLEMKRKLSSSESSSGNENIKIAKHQQYPIDSSDDDDDLDSTKSQRSELTAEDEDRRKRRRERNKIAATKCRMKKRERTLHLVSESEILETQNIDLKSQVRHLKLESEKLTDMLLSHSSSCVRQEDLEPLSNSVLKIVNDVNIYMSQQHDQKQQQQLSNQKIPSMNIIKYCDNIKPDNSPTHIQDQYSNIKSSSDFCKMENMATNYSKSPSDYLIIPTSNFKTANGEYSCQEQESNYIPHCDDSNSNSDGIANDEFNLKCELVDVHSPYTSVHSAETFLFENNESIDSDIIASVKKLRNNNNNLNSNSNKIMPSSTIIELNGLCHSFDSNHLKTEVIYHNSKFVDVPDSTEKQFIDLDCVTNSYNNYNTSNDNNSNSGCMA